MKIEEKYSGLEIAVIGLSARFPGSDDHLGYWKDLSSGKEMISTYSDEELLKRGITEDELKDSSFVRSASVIEGKEYFDSAFFEYRSEEALLMDPQIRVFHELCWKALEDAGYSASIEKMKIGLFGGAGENLNFRMFSLLKGKKTLIDPLYLESISQRTFLTTLTAYKLNLRGPSFFVDTACSTSLAAVHLACRSILTRECSIALAGGVRIGSSPGRGYFYEEGMIFSADGHCRAFDEASSGTISGEGAGVVVLKRLSDAIKDNDHIYAVIKSSAVNNDGNLKVGYTAPSVKGQADCIRMAHKMANIDPSTISYVETHGTGTKLGDPIEIHALNEAFGTGAGDKHCAIGSVKTNIGHLDTAAGIAGFIKTVLSLKNKKIPASLHFKSANPEIDFKSGPFYVNTELKNWERKNNLPLRAGVSSFGIGGTNVHVVLEEAPLIKNSIQEREYNVVTISAKTEKSLKRYQQDLLDFLNSEPSISLSDLCHTLQIGRKHFVYRKTIAFKDSAKLKEQLMKAESGIVKSKDKGRSLVFMFSGQGSQYVNMGKGLYEKEMLFKEQMDKGFEMLDILTQTDYRKIIFNDGNDQRINETQFAQPLLFLFEYSLAKLLLAWGQKPVSMIGHSIGEYAAACISGLMSFEDALRIVVKRGELMQKVEPGTMLSLKMSEEEAKGYLNADLSIAAVNGPEQLVISGTHSAIDELVKELELKQAVYVKLHTSHAFHSAMLENILDEFEAELKKIKFNVPQIPFISNLTGKEMKPEEAVSAEYWSRHMRETVKFSEGIHTLLGQKGEKQFIEVGPGNTLTTFVRQHQKNGTKPAAINLVRHPKEIVDDMLYFTDRMGQLWSLGVDIDWTLFYKDGQRRKISLPAYSFEKTKYVAEIDMFSKEMMTQIATASGKSFDMLVPEYDTEDYRISNERPDLETAYKEAETQTEKTLVKIFQDFFEIQRVGIEDNFFELGGDSLKAMILLRRIENDFNIKLTLEEFFRYENIRQISESLDEKIWLNKKSDKNYTAII